jgi:hypothetical protein
VTHKVISANFKQNIPPLKVFCCTEDIALGTSSTFDVYLSVFKVRLDYIRRWCGKMEFRITNWRDIQRYLAHKKQPHPLGPP